MPQASASVPVNRLAATMGFWSSLSAAVCAVLFAVLALLFAPSGWSGMAAYAGEYSFLQMANMVPVIFMALAVVVVVSCLHYLTPESRRPASLAAVAFTAAYAVIICVNYYLQLFVVRLNLLSGEWEGLSLLAMPNLHSAFFALEAIGYAFMSLATLLIIPLIEGGTLARWIRALLLINAGLGLFAAVAAPFDQPALIFAGLGLWSLVFPAAMILLAVRFRALGAAPEQAGEAAGA
jgi:hypothetical protein